MDTIYFAEKSTGKYLGGFACDPKYYPDLTNSEQVPFPPNHALNTWNKGLGIWIAHVPQPTQEELDRADAFSKADALALDPLVPDNIKAFVSALKKIL